jgi:dTDP-4-amino-4,6-dideoxygalactose transaminase
MVVAGRACEILYQLIVSTGRDAEYLIPANCCTSVSMTFPAAGVRPTYIDIDPVNLTIDHRLVKERIAATPERQHVLLYIRTYGNVDAAENFFVELKTLSPGILIVDDRCLCFPSLRMGWSGTAADVVLFSTGAGKLVELGAGGYAFLRDSVRYEPQHHEFDPQLESELIQRIQSAPDTALEMPAAWISNTTVSRLSYLSRVWLWRYFEFAKNLIIGRLYRILLSSSAAGTIIPSTWRYCVRLSSDRERVRLALKKAGIFSSTLYPPPEPLFTLQRFPNAQRLSDEILNIPFRPKTVFQLFLARRFMKS